MFSVITLAHGLLCAAALRTGVVHQLSNRLNAVAPDGLARESTPDCAAKPSLLLMSLLRRSGAGQLLVELAGVCDGHERGALHEKDIVKLLYQPSI